jgi:FkbM family methyltransferase
MLCFDIGANRGDFTLAALAQGYRVIALEPAPRVFSALVGNFIYNPHVTPLRMAVSGSNDQTIEFFEAEEDGLSTMNLDWLTDESMPYQSDNNHH